MKWLLAFVGALGVVAISPAAIAATYEGSVGRNGAKARLDFANGAVTGVLCIAGPGLGLHYDVYTIGGQNPEGRIAGRLLLNGSAVGSIAATKRTTQDEIIWEGTASVQGASKPLKLSRNPSLSSDLAVENGFRFGPKDKNEQAQEPDILIVTFPISKFDAAIAFLKSTPAVSKIETGAADSVKFISDTILDDCDRKLTDVMVLQLKVDAFVQKETYDKLVASRLFSGVRTTPVPLGPESMEISIPKSAIGAGGGSPRDISNFLDMLVERYFGQLRNAQSACRKHDGSSAFAALRDLPSGPGEGVAIDRLETNKFYFRRFSIIGPSRSLVFGLANHWEHYIVELKLYPSYGDNAAASNYIMQITLSTGEMAPFQEGAKPPAERFKPISDNYLETFVQKYSACISQYVTGSCPDDGGAWDAVRPICGR